MDPKSIRGIRLIRLKIRIIGEPLWMRYWTSGFHEPCSVNELETSRWNHNCCKAIPWAAESGHSIRGMGVPLRTITRSLADNGRICWQLELPAKWRCSTHRQGQEQRTSLESRRCTRAVEIHGPLPRPRDRLFPLDARKLQRLGQQTS